LAKQAVTPRERVHAGLLVFVFSALWIVLSGLFTFISVQVIFNQAEPVISSLIIAFILLYVVVNFEFVSERGIGAFTIPVRLSQRQLETWKIATGVVRCDCYNNRYLSSARPSGDFWRASAPHH
jgi:hypothetical protein